MEYAERLGLLITLLLFEFTCPTARVRSAAILGERFALVGVLFTMGTKRLNIG